MCLTETPPRVFISYSHDSEAHRAFVLQLANRLRAEGVESWIDRYVPGFPPQGWQRWMANEIELADFVLLVCTPLYLKRFNGEDQDGGLGVNFESVIVSQTLYDKVYLNDKFIPVFPKGGSVDHVPKNLRMYGAYCLSTEYQALYRILTKQPEVTPPPVGQTVIMPEIASSSVLSNAPSERLSLETAYLQSLLQQSEIVFADKNYVTLSGKYQKYRQLVPHECMMSASFLFEPHYIKKAYDPVCTCHGEAEQHDDLLAAFAEHPRLVLLGEPGTGKTFSLWRIAAEQARKALDQQDNLIPVVISLNRWTDTQQTLEHFVTAQMGALSGQLSALQNAGRLLPLLDALNEIPFDQRAQKLPQVRAFVQQANVRNLLLTCRQRDYVDQLEQDMDKLTIEPLDPPRIYKFLQNYFRYFENQQPGHFEKDVADVLFWQLAGGDGVRDCWKRWQAHGKAECWLEFWELKNIPEDWPVEICWKDAARQQQLNDLRSLLKLASNPYLLFLITMLYEHDRELPNSRIDLFGRFVKVLLKREETEKKQSREYLPDRDTVLQELKQLAWQLQSRSGVLEEAETRTLLSQVEATKIMPELRLEFAAAASLLDLPDNSVRFSHQLLQEFFTAQRFQEERAAGLSANEIWSADSWWQPKGWEEAARLAAEYERDPVPFLQWLAVANPKLAAEIARDQGVGSALEAFCENWCEAITDVVNYPNPHERHAISTALAWLGWDNRYGIGLDDNGIPEMDWVLISEGEFHCQDDEAVTEKDFKISRYPVTNQQFQAFVEDGGYDDTARWWEGLYKPDAPPEHSWQESNRPVDSVSWSEALAFCRWLSTKKALNICLPTMQQWMSAACSVDGSLYSLYRKKYQSGHANLFEVLDDELGKYNLGETSAVGIFPQQSLKPYELHDMIGNLNEWCLDRYDDSNNIDIDFLRDARVVRGEAWDSNPYNLLFLNEDPQYKFNDYMNVLTANPNVGFRCIQSPFDVPCIKTRATTRDIVNAVRESREAR